MPKGQSGMVEPLDPRDRTTSSPKLLRVKIVSVSSDATYQRRCQRVRVGWLSHLTPKDRTKSSPKLFGKKIKKIDSGRFCRCELCCHQIWWWASGASDEPPSQQPRRSQRYSMYTIRRNSNWLYICSLIGRINK